MWRKLLLIGLVLSFGLTSAFAVEVDQMKAMDKALSKFDAGQNLTQTEKNIISDELALREASIQKQLMLDTRQNYVNNSGLRSALAEGFEGTFPPAGWSVINDGDANGWVLTTSGGNDAPNAAKISYGSTAHDDWLVTPELEIVSGDSIILWSKNGSSSWTEEFNVMLSTTGNAKADFVVTLAANVAPATSYERFAYDLTTYAGSNVYVAFQAISTDKLALYIDDVSGPEIYVAPEPPVAATNPAPADAATAVALDQVLSWGAAFSATGYDLSFGTDNPPTNVLDASDLGDVLTYTPILEYSTTYYWTVVPYNAYGDATGAAVWSFTTDADPTLIPPFVEEMETVPPANWTKMSGLLAADTTVMTSTSSGFSADEFAGSSSNSMSANVNIYGTSTKYWLISPPVDLGDGSVDFEASFDLALTNWNSTAADEMGEDDRFIFLLSDDGEWGESNILREWNATTDVIPTAGMVYKVNLDSYAGVVQFAFYAQSTASNTDYDLYVDNFGVAEPPVIPVVALNPMTYDFGLQAASTSTSMDVTVTNNGGADLVIADVAVGAPFTAAYTGTIVPGASDVITVSFDPTTTGDFTGTLTLNITGEYAGDDTVGLMGSAFPATYSQEGFEDGELPFGWMIHDVTGNAWTVYSSTYYAHEGSFSVKGPYTYPNGESWLVLPQFALTTGDYLEFWMDGSSSSGTDVEIYISETGSDVADFTTLLDSYVAGTNQPSSYELISVDLSAYTDVNVYVALKLVDANGYSVYVDDFLMPAMAPSTNTPFFSEYMEGSSNNKGLEIYNYTGATINLDDYQIAQSNNGGGWQYYHTFPVGATLDHDSVWLIANDGVFQEVIDIADEVLPYPSVVHHNGNDGRALIHIVGTDTTIVDVIGIPDEDINWDVAGVSQATKDHNLVRKPEVVTGNTDWLLSAGTHADTSEWIVYEQNYWYGMGYHNEPYPTPGTVCEMALPYGAVGDLAIDGHLNAGDVYWYSFTTDGSYDYTKVSLCGSDFDTRVAVFEACEDFTGSLGSNPAGSIAYDDDGCDNSVGSGLASYTEIDTLDAGTYYVVVYGYSSSSNGDFTLTITGANGMPDFIVSDIAYYGQDTLDVEITNIGEADSPGWFGTDYHGLYLDGIYQGYLVESGLALLAGESHVYQVTGLNYDVLGSGMHQILIEADVDNDVDEFDETNNIDSLNIEVLVPPATPRHLMAMASGNQVSLTWDPAPEEALEVPPVPEVLSGVADRKIKNNLDSPEVLQKWASINQQNSGIREMGDDCSDPFLITSLPFAEVSSTAGFANSFPYGNGNDVVYQVTIGEAGYLTATTCAGTTGDTKLEIYAADCVTNLAQNDDDCGLRSTVTAAVGVGDYLIVVDGYSAGDVDYSLDVTFSTTFDAADLTVSDMWLDAGVVYAEVSNIGTMDNTSGPSCHWFVDGVDIGYAYTRALEVGGADTLALEGLSYANLGPGEFQVGLLVDYWDSTVEQDESNNMDSILVIIDEPDYIPVYNVYRNMTLVAEGVEPIDFAFSGGYIDWGLPVGDYCYQVTQMLPDSSESDYSNESCGMITPNSPLGLTLDVNPDASATLNWMAPLPPGELLYDDGSAESWMSVNVPSSSDHMMALRFNSPLAEFNISNIAIFGLGDAPTTFENLYITGGDGTGSPDMANILFTAPAVPMNGTWDTGAEWTMVPANVNSTVSEFFVVAQWTEGSEIGPFVGTDDNTATDRAFWSMDAGTTWNAWSSPFMIRAFIEQDNEVLSVGPTAPVIRNISTVTVPAMVNTTVEAPAFGMVSSERAFLGTFKVHRGTESGVYDSVLVADLTGTMYMDAPPVGDTPYFYAVSANYDEGDSPFTNEVSYMPEALAWLDLDIVMDDMFIEFEYGDTQASTGFDLMSIGLDTLEYSIEYHAPLGRVVTREIDGARAYGMDMPPAPGTTVDLNIYVQNDSQDAEWIDSVTVEWPEGITVNSSTDLVVVTAESHYLTTNNATGDGAMIEWMNHDGGYGNIYSTELAMATVNVTVDAAYTGDVYFDYYLLGDIFGADPHEIWGTFVYMLPAFSVGITPDGTMLLPDSTAAVSIDVDVLDYHAGFYPGTISIFSNAVNAPPEIMIPFDVSMAPPMGVLSGVITSGFDNAVMEDVAIGVIETNTMQEYLTLTLADGSYMFDLPAGNYDVGMAYPDYLHGTMNVDVEYNQTTVLDYAMAPNIPAPAGLTAMEDGDVYLHWNLPTGPGDAFSEGFESGAIPGNWTTVDVDADGNDWGVWDLMAHTGMYSLASFSYSNTTGPLFPNNYLITPPVALDGASELSFWVAASDASWYAEHLQVKISTTGGTPTDFVDVLLDYTLATDAWTELVVDLSGYAGETGLIAFVHNDVTDQFNLSLDDITLVNADGTVMFSSDFEDPSDIEQFTMLPFRTSDDMTDAQIDERLATYEENASENALRTELLNFNIYSSVDGAAWGLIGVSDTSGYVDASVVAGQVIQYAVSAVYDLGESTHSDTVSIAYVNVDRVGLPTSYALEQNYPNPFNPITFINYQLPEATDVKIVIYNVLGQNVATLVDQSMNAGYHNVTWSGLNYSGTSVSSGVYLYRIETANFTDVKKLMFLK